ncbi:NADH-quinone oxidoreductase subunit N [Marinilongibacter aquaticus]|uniref:NADH-quinone oxidoreductase subunit N n=1 Tax=Marinilongibacter aquaticus TaxID=2975157 RepID=UPI0021BD1488|nr:NADH-quinone oxidoreductase subunit N [Marinilongibacter aquaticus]UBM57840.1 NADH-quinone oxidoreductase subunit N [Marinilongibacter aquaticus]
MYPIISLSITGLLTLFLGFSENKKLVFPATILFLALACAVSFIDWNSPGVYFSGMLEVNNMTILFSLVVLVSAILILALSEGFSNIEFAHPAEYFAIAQFALVGAIMMISYRNMVMLFLGIEILSVALYVLTGADKRNIRGNEAAIKYFLMGAFATGILLFGVAMYYGATGTLSIVNVGGPLMAGGEVKWFLWIGCTFILIAMLFKVSAAPFHFWTPDVYEGAPTIFTAFMATIVKTAGFVAILRMLTDVFGMMQSLWWVMFALMVVLSLVFGNIGAVSQNSFKRLLAYSSISHAGFMLLALLGNFESAMGSILFYTIAYTLSTVAAFGVLMITSKERIEDGRNYEKIDLFDGLAKNNGFLSAVLTIAMLSMAGIPLTAGFWAKFFVFTDAAHSGLYWTVVVAILMSAVAIYYYFKPIMAIWKNKEGLPSIELNMAYRVILSICTLGTVILGFFPDLIRSIF